MPDPLTPTERQRLCDDALAEAQHSSVARDCDSKEAASVCGGDQQCAVTER